MAQGNLGSYINLSLFPVAPETRYNLFLEERFASYEIRADQGLI